MNFVFVVNRLSYAGGAEQIAIKSAMLLKEKNHDVSFFFLSDEDRLLKDEMKKRGINLFHVKCRNYLWKSDGKSTVEKIKDQFLDIYNSKAIKFLGKNIDDGSVVLVHKMRGFSPSILKKLKEKNCRIFYTAHDYELFNYDAKNLESGIISKIYYNFFRRKYVGHIDKILVPSDFLKLKLVKSKEIKRIVTLRNFIEPTSDRVNIEREFDLGFFGRLENIKGIEQFCEAAVRTGYRVIIVGDGSCRALLESKYNNQNFTFLGNITKSEVFKTMAKTKVAVVPSLWNETFGLVVAEAIREGCKVVVSELGALHEVLNLRKDRGIVISADKILDSNQFSNILYNEVQKFEEQNEKIELLSENEYYENLIRVINDD